MLQRILAAGLLLLLASGCSGTTSSTWPDGPLADDERELMELHDGIWKLIGLSTPAARELNGIVLRLRRSIRFDENRRGELEKFVIPGTLVGQSPTRERFIENHRNRFRLLGISETTQKELFAAMDRVWTALHDPSAPAEERKRAERIRALMVPSLPPCQDDKIIEYRTAPGEKKK